jgi:hypothetical protein
VGQYNRRHDVIVKIGLEMSTIRELLEPPISFLQIPVRGERWCGRH